MTHIPAMQTILRCLNCGNQYDADERPDCCDVCGAALYGEPEQSPSEQPGYWEIIDALYRND